MVIARVSGGGRRLSGAVCAPAEVGVAGEGAGADEDEEEGAEPHAEVGAGFVGHGPEAVGGLGAGEEPEAVAEKDGDFGGEDGDGDVDKEEEGGEAGKEAEDEEGAGEDFDGADEGSHDVGAGMPMRAKRPAPEFADEEELLEAFGKKDGADEEADEQGGGGCAG